jgi:type I restriction enzyme S subunit
MNMENSSARLIPVGWELQSVEKIGQVRGGKRLPTGYSLVSVPTPFPYVRVSDMRPGGVDLSDIRYVPAAAAPAIRNYRIGCNDIFISVAGTLGVVGRVPETLDGANLTENADLITSLSCDPDYLMYYLMSDPIQAQIEIIRTVGAQPKLALSRLRKFSILVPVNHHEQHCIAGALKDADALVMSLERLIAKKEAVKQGVTQRLLTGRTRLAGFAGAWSVFKLGQLGSFLKGYGPKRNDVRTAGIACIRYGELYTTYRDYTSTTVSFVNPSIAAAALPIRHGDLLFAGSGETRDEIGTCIAFTGRQQAVAGGDIIVLRAPRVNPIYLSYLTNTPIIATQKARLGQGDAVVHISSRALGSIEVDLPPRDEQDAITRVLVDTKNEIQGLNVRLAKAKAIKQGMMQELLTGRARLPVAEEAAA